GRKGQVAEVVAALGPPQHRPRFPRAGGPEAELSREGSYQPPAVRAEHDLAVIDAVQFPLALPRADIPDGDRLGGKPVRRRSHPPPVRADRQPAEVAAQVAGEDTFGSLFQIDGQDLPKLLEPFVQLEVPSFRSPFQIDGQYLPKGRVCHS